KQTLNHLSSHPMLPIESPSTVNSNPLAKQHIDQMDRLGSTYLSSMLSKLSTNDDGMKLTPPSTRTLDKFSIDELYEYLLRLDPNLKSLAEKLKSERVTGADLVNFNEDDYNKCSITYGEKKKLQFLVEQKQLKVNSQSVVSTSTVSESTPMQNEITNLKEIIKKQEQEIQGKNSAIQQLEDIVEKQDQQTRLQEAIINQLQESLEKQTEEMRVLIELVQQHRSIVLSPSNSSDK
ncbi:unnamed protein product, partial [Rotaria sp. Silwood2]